MNKETTRSIGKQAEDAACRWLEQNGYSVVVRNYTTAHGEIDIIAEDEKYIVFVEVKYRTRSVHLKKYGRPVRAVTKEKQKHIIFSAKQYISQNNITKKPRLDVMEITGIKGDGMLSDLDIKYYKNAFGE